MDLTSTFAPITKTVDQDDGSLLVYGKATDDSLDLDDQRCDAEWLKTAMPEWFRYGNIREQHRSDSAIGKAIEHEAALDGHYITARIVDPVAVVKTRAGVFTGFSIGIRKPKIVKSDRAPNGLINGGMITEISLVDRPANSNAMLTLCKAAYSGWEGAGADLDAERGLIKCEELSTKTIEPDLLKVSVHLDGKKIREVASDAVKEATDALADIVKKTTAKPCCDDCSGSDCGCCDDCSGVSKATDIDHLDAPAPGQKCADCGKDGHVMCFDRDKAIALVEDTISKASDGLGGNESSDIAGAHSAISTIAQLIISEAKELADMPAQDCDIHLLMSAVDALRCFARREEMEQLAIDPDTMVHLGASVDLVKGKYSAEDKRRLLSQGKAIKNESGDPSYPIADKEDLSNAIQAVGRGSGSHDNIRSYIIRRAKALGASDMIPDNWSASGSNKAADSEVVIKEGTPMTEEDVKAVNDALEDADEAASKAADSDAVTEPVDDSAEGEGVEKSADSDDADGEHAESNESDEDEVDTKATEPDLTKAVGEVVTNDFLSKMFEDNSEILIKAVKIALDNKDSELRKMFVDIAEDSAKSTVKAFSEDLGARLEKVESMATPGGPNLRRTEVERVNARKSDLTREVMRYKAMASASEDPDLRKGYTQKALQIDAELKAL